MSRVGSGRVCVVVGRGSTREELILDDGVGGRRLEESILAET